MRRKPVAYLNPHASQPTILSFPLKVMTKTRIFFLAAPKKTFACENLISDLKNVLLLNFNFSLICRSFWIMLRAVATHVLIFSINMQSGWWILGNLMRSYSSFCSASSFASHARNLINFEHGVWNKIFQICCSFYPSIFEFVNVSTKLIICFSSW